jgi:hypothetical protein
MNNLRRAAGMGLLLLLWACNTAVQPGSTERVAQETAVPEPALSAEPEALPPVEAPPTKPDGITTAALPESDPQELLKLDTAETADILGAPHRTEDQAPALIWIYEVPNRCVLRLFFYPELDGTRFLALTYSIEPESNNAGERACVTALRRAHVS